LQLYSDAVSSDATILQLHDLASDTPYYIADERVMRVTQLQNHLALILGPT